MSKIEHLRSRFFSCPSDFTYTELKRLLNSYGYEEKNGAGSRVKFVHTETKKVIILHKPHPGNIVKQYVLRQVADTLKEDKNFG